MSEDALNQTASVDVVQGPALVGYCLHRSSEELLRHVIAAAGGGRVLRVVTRQWMADILLVV